jgi:hypothetical protein
LHPHVLADRRAGVAVLADQLALLVAFASRLRLLNCPLSVGVAQDQLATRGARQARSATWRTSTLRPLHAEPSERG